MAFEQTPQSSQNAREPVMPLRIERGAEVFCTDGAYGTVQQVVMDPASSQLQGIVVLPLGAQQEVVIDIKHVARAGNDQVYLDCSRQAIRDDPVIAQPYNAEGYRPVSEQAGLPPKRAAGRASAADQPVVTGLEPNAVNMVAPAHEVLSQGQPPAPREATPTVPRERLTADWHVPGSIASVAPQQLDKAESAAFLGSMAQSAPSSPIVSDRRLETPQASSAQQEAQQVAPNTASVAPLSRLATASPSANTPSWLPPTLVAAGTVALIGGVTVGALVWQRRRRPTGLDWWRMQLSRLTRDPQQVSREVAQTVTRTVAQNIEDWKPEFATAAAQASEQLDAWRSLLGEQIETWRESNELTGEQAMSSVKQFQKTMSKNASKGLEGWIATLGALGALAGDQLQELGDTLGNQVEDWRHVLNGALMSNSPSFPQSLGNSAKAVTNAPRRAVRRGMVGMRWFRRGIFFGAILGAIAGLLFAPVPGSQLRTTIFAWLAQVRGQAQDIATNALSAAQRTTTPTGSTSGSSTTSTTGGTLSGTRPIG